MVQCHFLLVRSWRTSLILALIAYRFANWSLFVFLMFKPVSANRVACYFIGVFCAYEALLFDQSGWLLTSNHKQTTPGTDHGLKMPFHLSTSFHALARNYFRHPFDFHCSLFLKLNWEFHYAIVLFHCAMRDLNNLFFSILEESF